MAGDFSGTARLGGPIGWADPNRAVFAGLEPYLLVEVVVALLAGVLAFFTTFL
jgi:hypothetical protein